VRDADPVGSTRCPDSRKAVAESYAERPAPRTQAFLYSVVGVDPDAWVSVRSRG